MTTRLPLLVLLGALATTPGFSADRSETRIPDRASAQVQAANLLRGTTPASPLTLRQAQTPVDADQAPRAKIATRHKAHQDVQAQAQRLLTTAYSRKNPTRLSR
jgi:hypothetical protein